MFQMHLSISKLHQKFFINGSATMERPRRVRRHASRIAAISTRSGISSAPGRRTTSKSSFRMLGFVMAGDAFRFSISLYLRQASYFLLYRQKLRVSPQVFPLLTYHASPYTEFHPKDPKNQALSYIYQIKWRQGTFVVPISCKPYLNSLSQNLNTISKLYDPIQKRNPN